MQTATLVLSRKAAAETLCISLRMLDYLLARGELRGLRIGRRLLIPRTEIERLLSQDTSAVLGLVGSQE